MTQDEQLKDIFQYYSSLSNPTAQENIISMLREIQDVLGCIPQGVAQQAALAIGTKASVLNQLVKLYPSLKSAAYSHRIVACSGARCGAKQGAEIYRALQKVLQPDQNGVSQDGTILLTTQNCLKHCGTAPNIMVDGVIHEHMTIDTVTALAKELSSKPLV